MLRNRWLRALLAGGVVALTAAGVIGLVGRDRGAGGGREIVPSAETDPVGSRGDADDPAIWVNRADPARSTVIGTDKESGLAVYDLAGRRIQFLPAGNLNNVDLRDGFPLGGHRVSLVTAADRSEPRVAIYRVDPARRALVEAAARPIEVGIPAHGSCMYRSRVSRRFYVFVNSEETERKEGGSVEQWELFDAGDSRVDARKVRAFEVGSQTEGCVADDELGKLYIAEEDEAIWEYGAEPSAGAGRTRIASADEDGPLVPDIEGLAIAEGRGSGGYLIASSQGSDSFVVYRRDGDNRYVKTFRVRSGNGIDAPQNTDGIDVTTMSLGPLFPRGLFVAQDGREEGERTGFKLIRWDSILGGR